MAKKYTSEQFWKLYENLPRELKDALFSEETGNNTSEICKKYEAEKNLGEIVDCIGAVLVGVLPPEDFQKELEKEIKMEKETAKKVAQEINRFIFYPVKPALEQLYNMGVTKPDGQTEKPVTLGAEVREETPVQPAGKDTYREQIE
ncbi:MAG: hypothetical protein Q7K28_00655 [Candidatus Wildermuthbacteria bacterium]|nr:hypothetical protein [Candidatus Wildermuthbacteria bacterium]